MQYWLMKSEPDEFSFADLERKGREPWTGVRNYQARNYMRTAQVGDIVLFYHSNCNEPGIAGLAKVSQVAFPDPTQFDAKSDYFDAKAERTQPRWFCIEVSFYKKFKKHVSLDQLRAERALQTMPIMRAGNRLSVTPVTATEFKMIQKLGS